MRQPIYLTVRVRHDMNEQMSISSRNTLETYLRNCQTRLDKGDLKSARRYFECALSIVKDKLKFFLYWT
jgi:hypothetical protein